MSTTTTRPAARTGTADVAELGVGLRFSLHPATDDFVDVILGALAEVEAAGLTAGLVVATDDVSTYVGARQAPAEQQLGRYVTAVVAAAAARTPTGHVVAHVLLSRGCPGEATCDLSTTALPEVAPVEIPATGVRAVAQWSLYPLLDGGSDAGSHMAHIEAAVARARERGTAAQPAHYATRLEGDLADVLATAVDAWAGVGSQVPHVVAHLTVSVGSPSAPAGGLHVEDAR